MPKIAVIIEWPDSRIEFTAEHLSEYLENYPTVDEFENDFTVTELEKLEEYWETYYLPSDGD